MSRGASTAAFRGRGSSAVAGASAASTPFGHGRGGAASAGRWQTNPAFGHQQQPLQHQPQYRASMGQIEEEGGDNADLDEQFDDDGAAGGSGGFSAGGGQAGAGSSFSSRPALPPSASSSHPGAASGVPADIAPPPPVTAGAQPRSNALYINGLPAGTSDADVRAHFARFGRVTSVSVDSKKGRANVVMADADEASKGLRGGRTAPFKDTGSTLYVVFDNRAMSTTGPGGSAGGDGAGAAARVAPALPRVAAGAAGAGSDASRAAINRARGLPSAPAVTAGAKPKPPITIQKRPQQAQAGGEHAGDGAAASSASAPRAAISIQRRPAAASSSSAAAASIGPDVDEEPEYDDAGDEDEDDEEDAIDDEGDDDEYVEEEVDGAGDEDDDDGTGDVAEQDEDVAEQDATQSNGDDDTAPPTSARASSSSFLRGMTMASSSTSGGKKVITFAPAPAVSSTSAAPSSSDAGAPPPKLSLPPKPAASASISGSNSSSGAIDTGGLLLDKEQILRAQLRARSSKTAVAQPAAAPPAPAPLRAETEVERLDDDDYDEPESMVRVPSSSGGWSASESAETDDDGDDRAAWRTPVVMSPSGLHISDGVVGTCLAMCSQEELERRKLEHKVLRFERDRATGEGDPRLAVKEYKRSAAGDVYPASWLRPPQILVNVVNYLTSNILDADKKGPDPRFLTEPPDVQARAPTLLEIQSFCWDRFRSVVKDFLGQNYRTGGRNDAWAQETLERIVRAHVLFNYECWAQPVEFAPLAHSNEEQLNAHLKTLLELYDDARRRSIPGVAVLASPCEDEFRAYYILMFMGDNEASESLQAMLAKQPPHILRSPRVQHALACWSAFKTNDYVRFFRLVRNMRGAPPPPGAAQQHGAGAGAAAASTSAPAAYVEGYDTTPYLTRCLLARYFPRVRQNALRTINNAIGPPPGKGSNRNPASSSSAGMVSGSDSEACASGGGADLSAGYQYLKWSDLQAMLALPNKTSVIEICELHGVSIKRRGATGVEIATRENTFIEAGKEDLTKQRRREAHLIMSPIGFSRKMIVDDPQWAATSDAAAFAPVGSASGIFPRGSRIATEITPTAAGRLDPSQLESARKGMPVQPSTGGAAASAPSSTRAVVTMPRLTQSSSLSAAAAPAPAITIVKRQGATPAAAPAAASAAAKQPATAADRRKSVTFAEAAIAGPAAVAAAPAARSPAVQFGVTAGPSATATPAAAAEPSKSALKRTPPSGNLFGGTTDAAASAVAPAPVISTLTAGPTVVDHGASRAAADAAAAVASAAQQERAAEAAERQRAASAAATAAAQKHREAEEAAIRDATNVRRDILSALSDLQERLHELRKSASGTGGGGASGGAPATTVAHAVATPKPILRAASSLMNAVASVRAQIAPTTLKAAALRSVKDTILVDMDARVAELEADAAAAIEAQLVAEIARAKQARIASKTRQARSQFLMHRWLRIALKRRQQQQKLVAGLGMIHTFKPVPSGAASGRVSSVVSPRGAAMLPSLKRRRSSGFGLHASGTSAARGHRASGSVKAAVPRPSASAEVMAKLQRVISRRRGDGGLRFSQSIRDAWRPIDVPSLVGPRLASISRPHAATAIASDERTLHLYYKLIIVTETDIDNVYSSTPSGSGIVEKWLLSKLSRGRGGVASSSDPDSAANNDTGAAGGVEPAIIVAPSAAMSTTAAVHSPSGVGSGRFGFGAVVSGKRRRSISGSGVDGGADAQAASTALVTFVPPPSTTTSSSSWAGYGGDGGGGPSPASPSHRHPLGADSKVLSRYTTVMDIPTESQSRAFVNDEQPSSMRLSIVARSIGPALLRAASAGGNHDDGSPAGPDANGSGASDHLNSALSGAQAVLFVLHVYTRSSAATESSSSTSILIGCDWTAARARLGSSLLPLAPDAGVSLAVAVALHVCDDDGRDAEAMDGVEWCDIGALESSNVSSHPGASVSSSATAVIDAIRSAVTSGLSLEQIPASVILQSMVTVINPMILLDVASINAQTSAAMVDSDSDDDERAYAGNKQGASIDLIATAGSLLSAARLDRRSGGQLNASSGSKRPSTPPSSSKVRTSRRRLLSSLMHDRLGPGCASETVLAAGISWSALHSDSQPRTSQIPVAAVLGSAVVTSLTRRPINIPIAVAGSINDQAGIATGPQDLVAAAEESLRGLHAYLVGGPSTSAPAPEMTDEDEGSSSGALAASTLVYPPPDCVSLQSSASPSPSLMPGSAPQNRIQASIISSCIRSALLPSEAVASEAASVALQSASEPVALALLSSNSLALAVHAAYANAQGLLNAHIATHPDSDNCDGAGQRRRSSDELDTTMGPGAELNSDQADSSPELHHLGICGGTTWPYTPTCVLTVPRAHALIARTIDRMLRAWADACAESMLRAVSRLTSGRDAASISVRVAQASPPWPSILRVVLTDRIQAACAPSAVLERMTREIIESTNGDLEDAASRVDAIRAAVLGTSSIAAAAEGGSGNETEDEDAAAAAAGGDDSSSVTVNAPASIIRHGLAVADATHREAAAEQAQMGADFGFGHPFAGACSSSAAGGNDDVDSSEVQTSAAHAWGMALASEVRAVDECRREAAASKLAGQALLIASTAEAAREAMLLEHANVADDSGYHDASIQDDAERPFRTAAMLDGGRRHRPAQGPTPTMLLAALAQDLAAEREAARAFVHSLEVMCGGSNACEGEGEAILSDGSAHGSASAASAPPFPSLPLPHDGAVHAASTYHFVAPVSDSNDFSDARDEMESAAVDPEADFWALMSSAKAQALAAREADQRLELVVQMAEVE